MNRPPHPPSPRMLREQAARTSATPTPTPTPSRASVAEPAADPDALAGPRRLRDGPRTALLFGIAFAIAAWLYWPAFERKVNLPDALYGLPLVLTAVVAVIDSGLARRPFTRSLWLAAAVLPAAVFARVVYDGVRDPTSHNLWPFELAIAFGVSLPAALVGSVAGWLLLRATGRHRDPMRDDARQR